MKHIVVYDRIVNVPEQIENLEFYKAYTMWRLAAIYQGIVKRVEDGTAASADAYRSTEYVEVFAEELAVEVRVADHHDLVGGAVLGLIQELIEPLTGRLL